MPTTRRRRSVTSSSPTCLPAPQPQAPAEPPWLEHPTLSGLRDRLQLVYDCWTLLKLEDGTSRRPVYIPRGIEEPETCYIKRLCPPHRLLSRCPAHLRGDAVAAGLAGAPRLAAPCGLRVEC